MTAAPGRAPRIVDAIEDELLVLRPRASARWGLTRRQAEVLTWIVRGARTSRIGAELGISDRTVEDHVAAILEKAGFGSRAEVLAVVLSGQASSAL